MDSVKQVSEKCPRAVLWSMVSDRGHCSRLSQRQSGNLSQIKKKILTASTGASQVACGKHKKMLFLMLEWQLQCVDYLSNQSFWGVARLRATNMKGEEFSSLFWNLLWGCDEKRIQSQLLYIYLPLYILISIYLCQGFHLFKHLRTWLKLISNPKALGRREKWLKLVECLNVLLIHVGFKTGLNYCSWGLLVVEPHSLLPHLHSSILPPGHCPALPGSSLGGFYTQCWRSKGVSWCGMVWGVVISACSNTS